MARDRWDSRIAFVLASIGSAIGLGNIWRFPYVCYKYGGGAFLIAYLVALFAVGIPLLQLEFSFGHKTESAAPRAFKKAGRHLEFFGWGAVCVAFVITFYYAVVMGWCFYYGVSATTLAWGDDPGAYFHKTVLHLSDGPFDVGGVNPWVIAGLVAAWIFIVLSIWKGAKTVGKVVYLTVLVPWLLLVIFVVRGVTLTGAVDGLNYYLTPDFARLLDPEVWLQAFTQVFFSLSLGFGIMIAYASFLPRTADISNNAYLIGLSDAATAFVGGLAVFGALGFHAHTIGRDVDIWLTAGTGAAEAVLVAPGENGGPYQGYLVPEPGLSPEEVAKLPERAAESLKAHVKAFSWPVDHHAVPRLPEGLRETRIPVETVVEGGPGLAFVTYPTIISSLPVAAPLFGVLFFLMLLTLAVDSAFSLVEAAAAAMRDKWGWSHRRSNLTIAAIGFAFGIPFTLGFGLYWLDIVDRFMTQFGLTTVCLGECLFLGWAVKSRSHEPLDVKRCAARALPWGVGSFLATAAAVTGAIIAATAPWSEGWGGLAERIPVIVISADAVALFVLLVIFTSDRRYVEDLRLYANEQSDFSVGRWWNFLVRYIAPLVLIFLIVQEVRERIAAPYEGYPRLAIFLGGWLLLHVIVFLAFALMFLRGKEESK